MNPPHRIITIDSLYRIDTLAAYCGNAIDSFLDVDEDIPESTAALVRCALDEINRLLEPVLPTLGPSVAATNAATKGELQRVLRGARAKDRR